MEAEPCSGITSVVDKKRKRKREKSNRKVNVISSLPSPADSCSALENSKAQLCNEIHPLPANRRKKNKKKKKKKIQETSTAQGDTGAEVPCSVLQANELDVKYNITCSSGNSHVSFEHEKVQPTGETNCLTRKQMKRKEKKKLRKRRRKEAKAWENVSGKSDAHTEIPNNVSQVAELDENILKEFSSTCGKQSDIEKSMCLI